jgi:hypothetical protein
VRLCRVFSRFLPAALKCPEWNIPVPNPIPRR